MEIDNLLQLGIGATVAILLVREVLGFLKSRNQNNGVSFVDRVEWERWRTVEEAVKAHTHSVKNNTQVLTSLSHHILEMRKDMADIKGGSR
jgi:hypothetical protein